MTTAAQTLAIVGAAEGSWFSVGTKTVDVRYQPSFANANSGLSFGTFQFDVSTSSEGKEAFRTILKQAIMAKTIDEDKSNQLFKAAATANARALMTDEDVKTVSALMSTPAAKSVIDTRDELRAKTLQANIDGMIQKAAAVWAAKKIVSADIFTQGKGLCLQLFAYLLASLNRYPANQQTFQNWLEGRTVKTANGPVDGFTLTAPPTLDQMHEFFRSLTIWDGTQGNYTFLRERLDPTLAKLLTT
jgi:hypothetical protein